MMGVVTVQPNQSRHPNMHTHQSCPSSADRAAPKQSSTLHMPESTSWDWARLGGPPESSVISIADAAPGLRRYLRREVSNTQAPEPSGAGSLGKAAQSSGISCPLWEAKEIMRPSIPGALSTSLVVLGPDLAPTVVPSVLDRVLDSGLWNLDSCCSPAFLQSAAYSLSVRARLAGRLMWSVITGPRIIACV
ncbi:hypothetical protein BD289DRAFT_58947 [Coniella lustricola]|uniref:Uncharacterized protein n=1 Tax=Coniella lustricola TaxID=2025994 RepID=A0A2T3A0V2_9PEZI|nr:hypothetical protein BD289DRAFT_58947 [Coniella lustricola]